MDAYMKKLSAIILISAFALRFGMAQEAPARDRAQQSLLDALEMKRQQR